MDVSPSVVHPICGAEGATHGYDFQGEKEMTSNSERPKSNRGFASMDSSKQREIASKGGKAAHAQGRAHEFTADEARVAGRKGGEVVSRDRTHMAAIGRAGGQARGRNRSIQAPSALGQPSLAKGSGTLHAITSAAE
jgi:general stress protein YciG